MPLPAARHRRREPAPGIFRLVLPLPFPDLTHVNAYLLLGDEGDTLVDCGIYIPSDERDHGWDDLDEALRTAGRSVRTIRRLVVTHPHIDHYGMAARLVEATGCELWLHRRAADELEMYLDPGAVKARLHALFAAHGVRREQVDELTTFDDWRAFVSGVVEPSRWLDGGETFVAGGRRWSVIHTPGHSAAHVCLFRSDDRALIAGDHLLGSITPHIDFKRGVDDDPLGDFLASLEEVERLDPALVLPGHGRPFEDGGARARAIARHHDRRLGAILQVIRTEPRTATEITDDIFGPALLDFQRRLALGEALAHLAYLRVRGEVERVERDGVFYYRKAPRAR